MSWHDVAVDRFGDPMIPEPETEIAYVGAPRCPWDGSAMPYTTFAIYYGLGAPEPGYQFQCQLCGWEDEIS